jgi:hypothetical protein
MDNLIQITDPVSDDATISHRLSVTGFHASDAQ